MSSRRKQPANQLALAFGDHAQPHEATATLPDAAAREAIVAERQRNVVVTAGAGTGKTTILVDRIIDLVAPRGDDAPLSMDRVAAITFTRRAAGELRYRLRRKLLDEHRATAPGARARRLLDALAQLDAAHIGTIHGFCESLLRLRPVEARLSPRYTIADDVTPLVLETLDRLRTAAEADTLHRLVPESEVARALVEEAAHTVLIYERTGFAIDRRQMTWGVLPSLQEMLAGFIETRDVPIELPPATEAPLADFRAAVRTLVGRVDVDTDLPGEGHRWLRRFARRLGQLAGEPASIDPAEICRVLATMLREGRDFHKGRDFPRSETEWRLYKEMLGKASKAAGTATQPLDARLRAPLEWLAARLVRLRPIVLSLYARVKQERGVVDQIDLLSQLRHLLRTTEVRAQFQSRFDHILVDEFQDTDPLQVEIVFFLCEDGQRAAAWPDVRLRPGALTVVGDPKQSIYRFRRADMHTFEAATRHIADGGGARFTLSTNFRSRRELIDVFNGTLHALLGTETDAGAGTVAYEPLDGAPDQPARPEPCVHVVPYTDRGKPPARAEAGRRVEARALCRYVEWLLREQPSIDDPLTGGRRPIRPADIAILAQSTTELPLLLERLEADGIPYTARGGRLFLGHPMVRRVLLALRALADPDDGAAMATLLGPPFFALEPSDLYAARMDTDDERPGRVAAARAIIDRIRSARLARTAGATLRDLIESSGLGQSAACSPNGAQVIAALYEVALELDRRTLVDGADFDAATTVLRRWSESPVYYDSPEPMDADAVQVMSIHQAKGLEFPVVIVWDGFAQFGSGERTTWFVERDSHAWLLNLERLRVTNAEHDLAERERRLCKAEARRIYYVATTRARELLVLPAPERSVTKSGKPSARQFAVDLLRQGIPPHLAGSVRALDTFDAAAPPEWAQPAPATVPLSTGGPVEIDLGLEEAWTRNQARLSQAIAAAVGSASETEAMAAQARRTASPAADPEAATFRRARFGPEFGRAVHTALQWTLEPEGAASAERVAPAIDRLDAPGIDRQAVTDDVTRALAALAEAGLERMRRVCEQAVALRRSGGVLAGSIDLLLYDEERLIVVDWKTDAKRPGRLEDAYPEYAEQLALYVQALDAAGWTRRRSVRAGVLLTERGEWLWAQDKFV